MRQTLDIPVENIRANRYQPRTDFDQDALMDLAQSIRENGLIQPITVTQIGKEKYEIIAGERRYRACVLAGFTTVPAVIVESTDQQKAEWALVENIQRENLSAVEEAKAYVQIMKKTGLTQEEIALRMGKSQSAVANKIRLLNLPKKVQQGVIDKTISERHARALLKLEKSKQARAYNRIVKKDLTVKETEDLVEKMLTPQQTKEKKNTTRGISQDLRIAFNTINRCCEMIQKTGIKLKTEEQETENDYRIVIKFPKMK